MLPKVIVHNSISLDGSLTNFEVNLPLHYELAGHFNADMHLVGSNTAKIGMDMFLEKIPKENKEDFEKPKKEGMLWAVPDAEGTLKGLLHVLRQSEYCKDVIVFVSESTPKDYIDYLRTRNYDYHICGEKECDLKKVLELLNIKYGAKTILTDTGSILSNLLMEKGLVSEISLLVHPVIVGKGSYNIFSHINKQIKLNLIKKEVFTKEYIWLLYKIAEK
ncbi:MAG: dihydrofolate reductase family protein [Candidatus Colwellbacteria bacterium]|nr:dihydrofolate reductase family protein [Candidatus Colwellbacteria bacterium]